MKPKHLAKTYLKYFCEGFGGWYMATNAPVGLRKILNTAPTADQDSAHEALCKIAGAPRQPRSLPDQIEWLLAGGSAAADEVLASAGKNPPKTFAALLERAREVELTKLRKYIESCLQAEIDELT
jgi:hypothetical protein